LVDLTVYQPSQPPQKPSKVHPSLWTPITTQNPYNLPSMMTSNPMTSPYPGAFHPGQVGPMYDPNYDIPIIKQYNIDVSGPDIDHAKLSSIFEDMLPIDNIKETYNTLSERLTLNDFIRSTFIKNHDGEDIRLTGTGGESCLVSYLKFIRLNPNVTKAYATNPYKNLPENTLIYKSCYPIRYDDSKRSVICARNSVSINIRIYKMNIEEYFMKVNSQRNDPARYNIWREIFWYEYVREQILKRRMCPNFVNMYSYFVEQDSKIDFNKLKEAKENKSTCTSQGKVNINDLEEALRERPRDYSGRVLVALTESPHYNIYEWASKAYERDGNVHRMVNTGFHTKQVWLSVFFQMISALYTLQKCKIGFRNFAIDENFFVKEISKQNNNTFWRYCIDGIEYYVPNEGFLVQFDSNFKEDKKLYQVGDKPSNKPRYKIYSNRIGGEEFKEEDIEKLVFKSFLKTVNPNSFSKRFENAGGVRPPESVMSLITKIYTDANSPNASKNIGYYLSNYFTMFMNNRVGTYLDEAELNNLRRNDTRDFTKGRIVVQETEADSYKFVMYLGSSKTPGYSSVMTREETNTYSNDLIHQDVPTSTLYHYSRFENITQKFKAGEPIRSDEFCLETYIM